MNTECISPKNWLAEANAKEAARPWWNKAWRQCRWAWENFYYQWIMKNQERIDSRWLLGSGRGWLRIL